MITICRGTRSIAGEVVDTVTAYSGDKIASHSEMAKRIAELERERLAVTNDEIRALLAEWLRQRSYSADLYQRTRAAMRALARGTN